MSELELKPCPFCGGKAVLHYNEVWDYWEVFCSTGGCNVRFPVFKDRRKIERAKQKAIAAWNKRAEEADK